LIPRYNSFRPRTIKEYYASMERAAARRKKRMAKRRELGIGPDRTTVIAQLDHFTSLLVIRRDRKVHSGLCLVCMAKQRLGLLHRAPEPIQCAYHVLPRGDGLVHWDLRNIIGACFRCNLGELHSRAKSSLRARYRKIHIEIITEPVLVDLERLAGETADYSTADLIAMRDERKSQLEARQCIKSTKK